MSEKLSKPSTWIAALWTDRFQPLRRHTQTAGLFSGGVLAALAALLIYSWLVPTPLPLTTREVNDTIAEVLASATPPPAQSALVYQVIRPSLVFIQTEAADENGEMGHGLGSGIVINANGNILTSLHVVANASEIEVIFADGTKSSARVLVEQPENDIAVLGASQLPLEIIPAVLGNPNALHIGDEAFVVGHPLGLYGSMSTGVISGLGRSFTPQESNQQLHDLIQIDAAVNPGNSGGPLLNRQGQVVGIVTALANPTEQDVFIGIGFAVPITIAGAAAGLPPY